MVCWEYLKSIKLCNYVRSATYNISIARTDSVMLAYSNCKMVGNYDTSYLS